MARTPHDNRPNLTLLEGGASNSRLTAKSGTPGVDTVRYRFRDQTERYLGLQYEAGVQHGARGEVRRTEGGVTVGAYPDGLVYVEGRLAAILNGEQDHSLRPGSELRAGAEAAAARAGVQAQAQAAVGRLDVTGELWFDEPEDGRRFLSSLAELDVPWLKTGTEGGKASGVETVYYRTARGRSVVMRAYDKGVETGQAPAGRWVRVERQRRYRKSREQDASTVASLDFAEVFAGRELARLTEHRDSLIGDVPAQVGRLRAAVDRGSIPAATAERLAGYLLLHGRGLPARTLYRREAELRAHGIDFALQAETLRSTARECLKLVCESFAA